jgi:hypothetical protein
MSTTTSMLTQPTLILSLRYAIQYILYADLAYFNAKTKGNDVKMTTTLLTRLTLILRLRFAWMTSLRHHFAD